MFGIVRIAKYKKTDLYGIQREANRTKEEHDRGTLNLPDTINDWNKTPENVYFKKSNSFVKDINKRLESEGIKGRKDSVYGVGLFCSASPEFFQNKTKEESLDYFRTMRDELVQVYCNGDESRLVNFVVHFDEKTPHAHGLIIPLVDNERGVRLSASDLIGNRGELHKVQNRLYNDVYKGLGFKRGQITTEQAKTERAIHRTTNEWRDSQRQILEEDIVRLYNLRKDLSSDLEEQLDALENISRLNAMESFINSAKIKLPDGTIKSIRDGFNRYLQERGLEYNSYRTQIDSILNDSIDRER